METRKVCENCLHWEWAGRGKVPGRGGEFGLCRMSTTSKRGSAPGATAVAVSANSTDDGALYTAPAHYCNQWEQGEA